MSKYGTIPASSSTPPKEGSTTTLDSTPEAAARRRPWREFADPRALSVPAGLDDARRRARANLAYFVANYGLVYLVFYSACLIWWGTIYLLPMVVPLSLASPGVVFRLLLTFTPFLLLVTGATAGGLVVLAVGLLLIAAHAVLHLPTDSSVDEEAGLCGDDK